MKISARNPCLKSLFRAVILLAVFSPILAYQEQLMDRLILYGEGYRFGVQEPAGWLGDWNRASTLKSNIIFYPEGHKMTTAYGMIRVRVNKKRDEDTAADLAADMEEYRKRFPTIEFIFSLQRSTPSRPAHPGG